MENDNIVTYCIYHKKDWDGVMSAAVVREKFPDAILIGWDYGDPSPIEQIQPKSRVLVCDVCLEEKDMLILHDKCMLYWCDHHKTQLEIESLKCIKGQRSMNAAGCFLTHSFLNSFRSPARGIILLSRYDIWDQSDKEHWDNEILPFQMGMRQYPLDPEHPALSKVLEGDKDFISDTIKQGLGIMRYEASQGKNYMVLYAFDAVLESEGKEYKVLAVNRQAVNSIFFESRFDEAKHDIMISYASDGKKTKYTMFSPYKGVDVGKIAKALGGGGHRNASGFEIKGNNCILKPI